MSSATGFQAELEIEGDVLKMSDLYLFAMLYPDLSEWQFEKAMLSIRYQLHPIGPDVREYLEAAERKWAEREGDAALAGWIHVFGPSEAQPC